MAHQGLYSHNRYSMRREAVRIQLLGGFTLAVGPRTVEADGWRLKKAMSLVKLLALAPRHSLHREQVADFLWPGVDARRAANNLHRTLHSARGVFESTRTRDYLVLRDGLLQLCPDGPTWVDVDAFEEAAAAAVGSEEPAAFRAALSLYAGDLLPENLYEEWTEQRRGDLLRSYMALLVGLGALYEKRGEYEKGIQTLKTAVARGKATDEGAHARLMRLYALSGRRLEAHRLYERLRDTLYKELGAHPTQATRSLYDAIRAGKVSEASQPAMRPEAPAPNNLPVPLTSFVGRRKEVLAVERSLSMTRLMTLTGTGGSGKTRLALEVARGLVGTYAEGVWLAELAPLSDPGLVARAVATTLGVREHPELTLMQAICNHLGSGRTLLVLDNCEHLVGAAARFTRDLLSACEGLTILATSREPLRVSGEIVWPVPTLSLPDPASSCDVEDLMSSEAVRLFVDRARSRLPAFELKSENAGAVASVCRELDGIPLAIELSTARMGALAVEQIVERLEGSLKLLSGGDRTVAERHQTLRATLDWSYDLLDEPERVLFRRLSVFAGGWPLEAAEVVGAGDGIEAGEVLDLLSRLVDKSMVVVGPSEGGTLRYGMLEPVRRYGEEHLVASGEAEAVRRRHARWYYRLAEEVEPWLRGARQEVWLERLATEYGNLRAALGWALDEGEVDLGLWFGGALGEFWYMSGNFGEGRRWLEAALAKSVDAPHTPARTRALLRAGWIAWEQGDYRDSVTLSEESLALSRELGDRAGSVAALSNLGWASLLADHPQRASALAYEAVELARAIGDTGGVARALLVPGLAAVAEGDNQRALALHGESLALAGEAEDGIAMLISLVMGVFASLGLEDGPRARALCAQSLAQPTRPRVVNATAFQLHASAAVACWEDRPTRSARLWGAAESLREAVGATLSPIEMRVYGQYIEAARGRLDLSAWNEAWAEGRAMTADQAVEYATSDRRRPRPRAASTSENASATKQPDGMLTRRQREVAFLVAGGLTNRQIASELRISENTVANHVAHILRKLDATSRSRIAIWAKDDG